MYQLHRGNSSMVGAYSLRCFIFLFIVLITSIENVFGQTDSLENSKYKPSGDTIVKKKALENNPVELSPKSKNSEKRSRNFDSEEFFERLVPGGNFSIWFGTTTYIEASPSLGYKVTERLIPGIGATYIYFSYPGHFQYNYYGGRPFARYLITENLFAHAEYEILRINSNNQGDLLNGGYRWVSYPLIGGGYMSSLGGGSVTFTALYNPIYDSKNSIYPSPLVVRAGIFF